LKKATGAAFVRTTGRFRASSRNVPGDTLVAARRDERTGDRPHRPGRRPGACL